MKTTIEAQREAIDLILGARTQGKRAASYGFTLLNKNPRVIRGIYRKYEKFCAKLGMSSASVKAQWKDIKDMAELEMICDE